MNVVVIFVFLLDTFEDNNSLFHSWFINFNRLHTALKGGVFFDDAVFIEGSSTH